MSLSDAMILRLLRPKLRSAQKYPHAPSVSTVCIAVAQRNKALPFGSALVFTFVLASQMGWRAMFLTFQNIVICLFLAGGAYQNPTRAPRGFYLRFPARSVSSLSKTSWSFRAPARSARRRN